MWACTAYTCTAGPCLSQPSETRSGHRNCRQCSTHKKKKTVPATLANTQEGKQSYIIFFPDPLCGCFPFPWSEPGLPPLAPGWVAGSTRMSAQDCTHSTMSAQDCTHSTMSVQDCTHSTMSAQDCTHSTMSVQDCTHSTMGARWGPFLACLLASKRT